MRQLSLLLILLSLLTLPTGCAIGVGSSLPSSAFDLPDPCLSSCYSYDYYAADDDIEGDVLEEAERQVLRKPAPVVLAAEFLIDAFDEGHTRAAEAEKRRQKDRLFSEFLENSVVRSAHQQSTPAIAAKQPTAQRGMRHEIKQASVTPDDDSAAEKTNNPAHRTIAASASKRGVVSPLLYLTLLVLAFGGATWRWLDLPNQENISQTNTAPTRSSSRTALALTGLPQAPPTNTALTTARSINDGPIRRGSLRDPTLVRGANHDNNGSNVPLATPIHMEQKKVTYRLSPPRLPAPKLFVPRLPAPKLSVPRLPAPKLFVPRLPAPKLFVPRLPAPKLSVPKLSAPRLDGHSSARQVILASQPCRALSVKHRTNRSLALLKIARAQTLPAISNRQQVTPSMTISLGGRSIKYRGKIAGLVVLTADGNEYPSADRVMIVESYQLDEHLQLTARLVPLHQ